jgi:hypothetical protein
MTQKDNKTFSGLRKRINRAFGRAEKNHGKNQGFRAEFI